MYQFRMGLCLLLGAALLAGCSDRKALTAPSARPLVVIAALVDRPYSWSFTCKGDWSNGASWGWTENGTVIASGSAFCLGDQRFTATGVRAATANGFTAYVGVDSKSWRFDPAAPFKASLGSSVGGGAGHCFVCLHQESGKLTVDS